MPKPMLLMGLPLLLAMAPALAHCPAHVEASTGPIVVADNAATSTPAAPAAAGKAPDAVAYPNSPNGSPVTTNKGAPVVTDKAACNGTGPTATCQDSPAPSGKADTSDTAIATPTTVNAQPAKP